MKDASGELTRLIQALEPLLLTAADKRSLLQGMLEAATRFPGIDGGWYGCADSDGRLQPALTAGTDAADEGAPHERAGRGKRLPPFACEWPRPCQNRRSGS
ncbi:hypothetical protein [Acidihalobacter prosperus]|uniref:Uncharacterized protein n=1 Tax=Acidihalobacter prosperus TaxID=160660 RepID=A0A1A6C1P5_9GAMM|nr:hypothetical protein [Acidihalobacter prosperus]OBS08470.1 hypothetical protein Thpro_022720 [Acidihalobacter prosperus]